MNKQALAFLTLFSLILMLSVYYVTLPTDTTTVMSDTPQADEEKEDDPEEEVTEETKEHTSLQEEANKSKDDEINKNSSIVSSPDASDAQKQEALETIEDLKTAKAMQEEVAKLLADEGYMAAVEIKENTCDITVFEYEDSKESAKKIMKSANSKIKNQYLIEVAFK